MPKYSYTAVDINNKKTKAVIEANDAADLRRILRGMGLVLIKYDEIEEEKINYRLKANEAAEFSRQISGMIGSGITIVRAIEIIKDRDFKKQIADIYQRLYRDVQQGFTLSEAMKLQGRAFPELLVNMYASGEASGQLERVAAKMAVHYEKEHRLSGKIKAAMRYPLILMMFTIVVVMALFTVVLPDFFSLLEGVELPALTRAVLAISVFLESYWYFVIVAALALVLAAQVLLTVREVAEKVDYLKLRLPGVGKLFKIIYTARFSRTLSSLYSSGLSMMRALEITSTIIGNKYIESQFEKVAANVRNGEPLSQSIGAVDGFDSKLATTILIGEESGRLDTMLETTAESFDYEAEEASAKLVQYMEPVMIVIMAAIICVVMLAVFMALITLNENAGSVFVG